MSDVEKLLNGKNKLQDELNIVSEKLDNFKSKLDDLLQKKVSLDEASTSVSKEIEEFW